MSAKRWLPWLIPLALLAFAACTGATPDELPTASPAATIAPAPTREAVVPAGEPGVTVEIAVLACREQDGELLRALTAGPVTDEELQALFDRGTLLRLVSQTVPEAPGDGTSITVRLEVSRDGATETVERDWALERSEDGVWRLTELPDCT